MLAINRMFHHTSCVSPYLSTMTNLFSLDPMSAVSMNCYQHIYNTQFPFQCVPTCACCEVGCFDFNLLENMRRQSAELFVR